MPIVYFMSSKPTPSRLTQTVPLPGGQDRLRQLILYISRQCAKAQWYGLTKLNKILWKADFDAFAARQRPITGRAYQRLELGPAPKEMLPLLRDMEKAGEIEYELTDYGDGIVERRPVALKKPNLSNFKQSDLDFVKGSISYYWHKTGKETSDESHGVAWKSRENNDPLYYELSFLSDAEISPSQRVKVLRRGSKLPRSKRAN
jgi:hypothetical protein